MSRRIRRTAAVVMVMVVMVMVVMVMVVMAIALLVYASDDLRPQVVAANESGLSLLESNALYGEYLGRRQQLAPAEVAYFGDMSPERWRFVVNNYRSDATDGLASMSRTPVLLLSPATTTTSMSTTPKRATVA